MHNERVGCGDIESGFDDRRRQQDIEPSVVKSRHDIFQLRRRQTAMRDRNLGLRHKALEQR
jgi:hypothetical protein